MNTIKLFVSDKVVYNPDDTVSIVCGNSTYQIAFLFDEEWNEFEAKTARFVYNDNVVDVPFTGDVVNVPIIGNTTLLKVGVFAGDLHTTTAAGITCIKSIRCEGGTIVDPEGSVYDRIMALIASSIPGASKDNIATGLGALALGVFTEANADGQLVHGKYNVADASKAHIVGGGSAEKERNIYALDWNGNATFAGEVDATGLKVNGVDVIGTIGEALDRIIEIQNELIEGLITFTVIGNTLKAKQGMTWSEFVESEYNIYGYYIQGDFVACGTHSGIFVTDEDRDYSYVSPTDVIRRGASYNHG